MDLQTLTTDLSLCVSPERYWQQLVNYSRRLNDTEWLAQQKELLSLGEKVNDEYRWAFRDWYAEMKEVGFDQREGPEYQFVRYRETPDPRFFLTRSAMHDFSDGLQPWLDFRHYGQIKHWQLNRLHLLSAEQRDMVFHTRQMTNLTGLSLYWHNADNREIPEALARQPFWQNCEAIRYEWLRSDDKSAFEPWFEALNQTKIKRFSLTHSNPDLAGFQSLAECSFLLNLEELTLKDVYLRAELLQPLLNSQYIPRQLRRLVLSDSSLSNGVPELTEQDMVSLIESPFFLQLREFDSEYHRMGEQGVLALLNSPSFHTLERLKLQNARITDAAMRMLFSTPWPRLREISIAYNGGLTPETLAFVHKSPLVAAAPVVSLYEIGNGGNLFKGG